MKLNQRLIFRFWLPLFATWLLMAIEGPFISAMIARLPDAEYNLGAYGVAFSLALILEAPIIMIMTLSTALVKDHLSFFKLRRFTYALNLLVTLTALAFVLPPSFDFIIRGLIGLPEQLLTHTYTALLLLLPWPAAIGFRRFFQGLLISSGETHKVAYGTVVRVLAMIITCGLLYVAGGMDGATMGAAALSAGVIAEAIAVRVMVRPCLRRLLEEKAVSRGSEELTYRGVLRFYYPLALTSFLTLAVHPIVTFFVGYSPMPIESLAVMPVTGSVLFIFRCFGLSFQEVAVALMGEEGQGYLQLRRFAINMALVATLLFVLMAYTPLALVWFEGLSGLTTSLANFAILPLQIMIFMPALSILMSWQRSLAVHAYATGPITGATLVEVGFIVGTMYLASRLLGWSGAVSASFAMMLGRAVGCLFLWLPPNRARDC